jgi:hypothetical protein
MLAAAPRWSRLGNKSPVYFERLDYIGLAKTVHMKANGDASRKFAKVPHGDETDQLVVRTRNCLGRSLLDATWIGVSGKEQLCSGCLAMVN